MALPGAYDPSVFDNPIISSVSHIVCVDFELTPEETGSYFQSEAGQTAVQLHHSKGSFLPTDGFAELRPTIARASKTVAARVVWDTSAGHATVLN